MTVPVSLLITTIPRYPDRSADLLGRHLVPADAFSQKKVLLVDPQVHEGNNYPHHEESEETTKGLSLQIMWG